MKNEGFQSKINTFSSHFKQKTDKVLEMKLKVILLKGGKWQASFCGEKSLFSWSHTE